MKILNVEHLDEGWLPDKTVRERLLHTFIFFLTPPPDGEGGMVIFGGIFASANLSNEC